MNLCMRTQSAEFSAHLRAHHHFSMMLSDIANRDVSETMLLISDWAQEHIFEHDRKLSDALQQAGLEHFYNPHILFEQVLSHLNRNLPKPALVRPY